MTTRPMMPPTIIPARVPVLRVLDAELALAAEEVAALLDVDDMSMDVMVIPGISIDDTVALMEVS